MTRFTAEGGAEAGHVRSSGYTPDDTHQRCSETSVMEIPSKEQITATFDALVAEDALVYGPHQVLEYECDGYPVSAHLLDARRRRN